MVSFKAKEVIAILRKLGFIQKRQTGSHLIMFNSKLNRVIPVPMHTKDIKRGTLKSIIKQAESSQEEFIELK